MQETPRLDGDMLQNLLGGDGSGTSLIPESVANTLTTSLIVMNVLMLIFLIFFLVGTIRRWKVQTAVLKMQKDVSDIKRQLNGEPVAVELETATKDESKSDSSTDSEAKTDDNQAASPE